MFVHAADVVVDPVGVHDCENLAVALAADAAVPRLTVVALQPLELTQDDPPRRVRRVLPLGRMGQVGSKSSRRYPEELKARAVQMVADLRSETVSEWEAMGRVADLLGVGTAETVRKWVRQAEIDAGARAGQTNEESDVLRRLRRENAELKRANAILKAASVFFAAELDRPCQ